MQSESTLGNRHISTLPLHLRGRLVGLGEPFRLRRGDVLVGPDEVIRHLVFPDTGAVSLLVGMSDGRLMETGLIGSEGVVGFPAVLGASSVPWQAIVQAPGVGMRVPLAALQDDRELLDALQLQLATFQLALYWQSSLIIACNRFHPVAERCARWLLMVHDRVGGDVVPTTHEFLSQMLGVRRPSVTEVLGQLDGQRLVRQRHRAQIEVLDRPGLEKASCECYFRMREIDGG